MKATIENVYNNLMPVVAIEHNGRILNFSASCFGKKSFLKDDMGEDSHFDVFKEINEFWSLLPFDQQTYIFDLYCQIANIFNDTLDARPLHIRLNEKVVELVDYHDFAIMRDWIKYHSAIRIPDIIKSEYVENIDQKGSRDQTYIRSDYIDLLTIALILRTMIPIWGEHILNNRKETGNQFKEFYAFKLIRNTKLIQTPAYDKLRLYIDLAVGDDKYDYMTIISGVSSEDFPEWMLGLVSIRRLCVGDITGTSSMDPRATLVSSIWKFVTQKVKSCDNKGDNTVKEKELDQSKGDLSDKLSELERYKIKYRISLGEIQEIEYGATQYQQIAYRLCPTLPQESLSNALSTCRELLNHPIMECQLTLMRWVLKPVISPRGAMYLSKQIIVNLLGITQAVLWYRGHHYLALQSTSRAKVFDNEYYISGSDSKGRLTKENLAELDKLYPYQKLSSSKKVPAKPTNFAVRSIEILTDNLGQYSWVMTADEEFIKEGLGQYTTRILPVEHGIRNIIAKLVIELGSRQWV